MKQYKLYEKESDWDAKEVEICQAFGIPNDGTTCYSPKESVNNPDHADFGKWLYSVCSEPSRNARPYFNSTELVNGDPAWFLHNLE